MASFNDRIALSAPACVGFGVPSSAARNKASLDWPSEDDLADGSLSTLSTVGVAVLKSKALSAAAAVSLATEFGV